MRILPVLFNTEMVRAILDDRKTATRRVVKKSQCMLADRKEPHELDRKYAPYDGMTEAELIACTYRPPYEAGDIMYVRETWSFMPCIECNGDYARGMQPCYDFQAIEYDDGDSISDGCFLYKADCKTPERITWRPSIHMPKQAARIWLKVTDVRVERLHDMTLDDFLAEGVVIRPEAFNDPENAYQQARSEFMRIWDSTIKKSQTNMNPWVWVIEFERCEKAITSKN